MTALELTESCLLHARYYGILPMHVDVPEAVKNVWRSAIPWMTEERAAAEAWRESMRPLSANPAPAHVLALVQRAQRPIRSEAA